MNRAAPIDEPLEAQAIGQMVDQVLALPADSKHDAGTSGTGP